MNDAAHGFWHYYLGVIAHPKRTLLALSHEPRRLSLGARALALNALFYTLVYVFLTLGHGAPSSFKPWLAIPIEQYYSYDRFILAPSMFGAWLLSAAVAQLASRLCSGVGSYEDQLGALGFAISVATLASLAHDLPDTFLGAIGVLDLKAYEVMLNSPTIWRAILWTAYLGSFVWFVALFTLAVEAVQRIRRAQAVGVGCAAFATYQLTFLIFNR